MGLDKGKGRCFNYQLGMCGGACIGEEKTLRYNLIFEEAFYEKRVKAWNFGKPILIKEIGEKSEIHLVDKWCYMGSVTDASESPESLKLEYNFDFDVYRILKRYLKNPNNHKNISYFENEFQNPDLLEL